MKISVIIRAYNEDEHIERLMLGIQAQRMQPHEVILVDSGSTDSTVEIARRYGAKIVPIDKSEFTFGRALNRGCAAATGDICVFPSAHVYPSYDTWLERLVAPFADERVVLSYGRQLGNEVNKFSEHQIFARWFPDVSVCPQKTYFCNNANCAIRHSVWQSQNYDETLTGLEDLAWGKVAQAKGGWLAYVAEAEIIHVHNETWEQVQNRYRREAIAMRAIDPHAKFGRGDLARLLFRNVFTDSRVAIRQGRLLPEFASIARFRYNQFAGTYRGYNDPPEISTQLRKRFYYPSRPRDQRRLDIEQERHRINYDALKSQPQRLADQDNVQKKEDEDASQPVVRLIRGDR